MPKVIKLELTKENINLYVNPEWQRMRRINKVKLFEKMILEGRFFEGTILTLNKINNEYRIINGSHRIQAIKNIINKYPDKQVTIHVDIHENLNLEEETKLYDDLAIETPQDIDDFLYIHKNEFPIYKLLKEDFPVKIGIYKDLNIIKFKHILQGAILSEDQTIKMNTVSRDQLLIKGKLLNEKDYEILKEFFTGYKSSFGDVRDNPFYKPAIIVNMIIIYLNNFGKKPLFKADVGKAKENLHKLYKKMLTDHILIQNANMGATREIFRECRERILYLSNRTNLQMMLI